MTPGEWLMLALAFVIGLILFVLYAALWVGAGCDAHLRMEDNERRCRR